MRLLITFQKESVISVDCLPTTSSLGASTFNFLLSQPWNLKGAVFINQRVPDELFKVCVCNIILQLKTQRSMKRVTSKRKLFFYEPMIPNNTKLKSANLCFFQRCTLWVSRTRSCRHSPVKTRRGRTQTFTGESCAVSMPPLGSATPEGHSARE